MGTINQNLRGIRIKVAVFGTPKSGKFSFLNSMCKITSTQGNLQVFTDENGDVFSFVPIVKSLYSENINLQIKMMGARDKKGDGIVWQSIFKELDGLIFMCRLRRDAIEETEKFLKKTFEYISHFGPREYSVPVVIFYNKHEPDISVEEFDKRVNTLHLKTFSGSLDDVLPFISAVRYVVKESLKKHQKDYERLGGKKNIEDAFEIVEVFRPAGVQVAEGSVIINPPEEETHRREKGVEGSTVSRGVPPQPPKEDTRGGVVSEEDLEELSEIVEDKKVSEDTVKVKMPTPGISDLSDRFDSIVKQIREIEKASQFFTLKISDVVKEISSAGESALRFQTEYNSLLSEREKLSREILELRKEYEVTKRRVDELLSLEQKNSELQSKIEGILKEMEDYKKEKADLERLLVEKERVIAEKESLMAIKVTEVDEIKENLKKMEIEKEKLMLENRTLNDRVTVLESRVKLLETENKRLTDELSKSQEEMLACKAEAEELQTNLGIKERELGELMKSKEEEIGRLKSDIAALKAELENRSAPSNDEEVRRLSSEIVNLQIEIASKDDRIKELENELSAKIREIEEMKAARPVKTTTTETVTPQMLARTIVANLKMKYWDDMLKSLRDGTFQKKYNPVFVELKKAYDSKIPENVENRDAIFQAELKQLIEELKKNI
jgi:chromosome segregation ATPase